MNSPTTSRSGYTLLELLLSLSLAVVLVGLIGGAIRFYAIDMNVRDMDIRQTQLAAAVMQMIEDDLRATLHIEPIDTSGLEQLLANTAANASGGGGGGGTGGGGTGGGGTGGGGGSEEDLSSAGIDSTASDSTTSDDSDLIDTTASAADLTNGAVLQEPGLIGNQYQIQIDLSRLPRIEEYMTLLDQSAANVDDIPSDLKTVTYYVQPAGAGGIQDPLDLVGGDSAAVADPMAGGGCLVRRSLDRAATVFASTNGGAMGLNQTGELLAPEINAIEFAYWDGVSWLTEWSSDGYGQLPLAVQVRLYMQDPQTAITGEVTEASTIRTFMHVVRLPLARPIEQDEDLSMTEAGI